MLRYLKNKIQNFCTCNRNLQEDDLGILSSTPAKQSSLKQLDQHNFNQFNDERDGYGSGQYFRPDYEPVRLYFGASVCFNWVSV